MEESFQNILDCAIKRVEDIQDKLDGSNGRAEINMSKMATAYTNEVIFQFAFFGAGGWAKRGLCFIILLDSTFFFWPLACPVHLQSPVFYFDTDFSLTASQDVSSSGLVDDVSTVMKAVPRRSLAFFPIWKYILLGEVSHCFFFILRSYGRKVPRITTIQMQFLSDSVQELETKKAAQRLKRYVDQILQGMSSSSSAAENSNEKEPVQLPQFLQKLANARDGSSASERGCLSVREVSKQGLAASRKFPASSARVHCSF